MSTYRSLFRRNLTFDTLLLIGFVLFYPFFLKISLAILIIYVARSVWPFSINNLKIHQKGIVLQASLVLFILYVISLSYTQNLQHGFKDLETKLGLFIFPLLAIFLPRNHEQRDVFMGTFVLAFCVASIVCITRSLYLFVETNDSSYFYYDQFSFLMHPTYFTMHLSMALLFHLNNLYKEDESQKRFSSIGAYVITILILVSVYLASSRAGIVIGFSAAMVFLFVRVFNKKQGAKKEFVIFSMMLTMVVILLSPTNSRFGILLDELFGVENVQLQTLNETIDPNPVSHRLLLFEAASSLALQNPLGVGVGDVQDELLKEYKRIGYEKAIEVRYNPHNQYLQTSVAIGYLGCLVLLTAFMFLFRNAIKNGNFSMTASLGIIVLLNAMFESILEVQRGVLFFTVVLYFLFSVEKSTKMLK